VLPGDSSPARTIVVAGEFILISVRAIGYFWLFWLFLVILVILVIFGYFGYRMRMGNWTDG
jgi:hypothetical protein